MDSQSKPQNPNKKKKNYKNRKRKIYWNIMLNDEEAAELNQYYLISQKKSRREYVLDLARTGIIVDMAGILKEVRRQGNNLNQIARQLNSRNDPAAAEILAVVKGAQQQWQSLILYVQTVLEQQSTT